MERYRGKVARNASATVRSPVSDEQIREYGRWKYRFRLQATADVLLISPSLFTLYLSPSFYLSLFHSFVLRSQMFSVYIAEKLVHARTRLFASRRVSTCTCVYTRVQIANPWSQPPKSSGLRRLRIRKRSYTPARDSTLVVRMFGLSFGFARRHGFRGDRGRDGRGREGGNGAPEGGSGSRR